MRAINCCCVAILMCCFSFSVAHAGDAKAPAYAISKTLQIGGDGRWDFITFDPGTNLLYVPRQTHTQIIEPVTGEVVADLADTFGVHGVAIAGDIGRGFTSNGKTGTVTIFDLLTRKILGTTTAGQGPDAILYDPSSKDVFVFNGKSNDVTVIDASANPGAAAKATIALAGKPEVAVTDGGGHVYLNIEDKSEVAVIDTKSMKVTAEWKIEGGEEPTGLAIDTVHHRLFSGCANHVMAVIDTETGKTLGTVPIGDGVDGCAFDPATGEAFASCGDGTLTVVKERSPGKFEVIQTVKTQPGARTIAIDPSKHTIYLPTADFEPKAPDEKRPKMKGGTFKILVVRQDLTN